LDTDWTEKSWKDLEKDTESETINLPNKKNTVKHLMPTAKEMG